MDILIYSLAILVVGVIVLAFYTTVQSFKMKKKELEIRELELKTKGDSIIKSQSINHG